MRFDVSYSRRNKIIYNCHWHPWHFQETIPSRTDLLAPSSCWYANCEKCNSKFFNFKFISARFRIRIPVSENWLMHWRIQSVCCCLRHVKVTLNRLFYLSVMQSKRYVEREKKREFEVAAILVLSLFQFGSSPGVLKHAGIHTRRPGQRPLHKFAFSWFDFIHIYFIL